MRKEYDFSKGVRGKFHNPDAELYMPVYLEKDMVEALRKLSKKKGVEIGAIVNELIRKDIAIAETIISK